MTIDKHRWEFWDIPTVLPWPIPLHIFQAEAGSEALAGPGPWTSAGYAATGCFVSLEYIVDDKHMTMYGDSWL